METKVVGFNSKELIEAITTNQVVCFPTETVYGMGVIYDSLDAFNELVKTKERKPDKPFTLMLDNPSLVKEYAYVNEKIEKLILKYMPGEITLLLRPKEDIYPWVKLDSKYVGIRVSGKEEVCTLISKVGKPMLVTSANISGQKVCEDFNETYGVFKGKVSYIVKGNTSSNTPSTIVICDEELILVREGSIKFEEIKKVWEE